MNYYDNEKNVEVTSDPSDGFMMTSKGEVSLYYKWNETTAGHPVDKNTTLDGVLTIDPEGIRHDLFIRYLPAGDHDREQRKLHFNDEDQFKLQGLQLLRW